MSGSNLVALFHDEATRLVRRARALAAGGGDAGSRRQELYRALHSLKGMCASVGLEEASRLAHEAEELARTAPLPARGRLARCLERLAERVGASADEADEVDDAAPALPPIRVELELLDRLVDEATRVAADLDRLEHHLGPPPDPRSLALRHALRRETRSLGRALLDLRLLRFGELAARFERLVARWSERRGVPTAFAVEGAGVRIDRGLAWRLLDPLTQLIRNAIAHGPLPGGGRTLRITLGAAREAGRLRFTVADDGRGLDPAAVRRRAIRRGVISAEQAARLDDAASLALLARDGMSRLRRADELAGRGVGLASVRAAVERLGGRLVLASRPNQGFTATLFVPARLAITETLLVEVAGRRFAVLAAPVRAVRTPDDPATGPTRLGMAERLGFPPPHDPPGHALLVDSGRAPVALLVDRVVEQREMIVRPLGAPLERIGPWAGAALLAEGGLALVIDPARLVESARM
ncbi:MAG: hypothetical protein Kow0062_08380 [Acidobacteriota bacterium]